MTCTDGGEDNSPVHNTYHEFEDQVTLGADLLVFGRVSLFETEKQLGKKHSGRIWACLPVDFYACAHVSPQHFCA